MHYELQDGVQSLGVDDHQTLNKRVDAILNNPQDKHLIVECYQNLIPLFCEQNNIPYVMDAFINLFAAYHQKLISQEKLLNFYDDIYHLKYIHEKSLLWSRIKLIEAMTRLFEFSQIKIAKDISESIKDFFKNMSQNNQKDERDSFHIFYSLQLAFADFEDNDEKIEEICKFLFPNIFPYNQRFVIVFEYGSALFFYHKKNFTKAASFFSSVLEKMREIEFNDEVLLKRKLKSIELGVISNLLSNNDMNFSKFHNDPFLVNFEMLFNTLDEKFQSISCLDEKCDDFKWGYSLLKKKFKKKKIIHEITSKLSSYSRVEVSYCVDILGLQKTDLLKYAFQAHFLQDGDYLVRIPQKKYNSDISFLNALTSICKERIGPSMKIYFSGVTIEEN